VLETGEIEAFLAVAQERHFTRAAERLALSPSRVSQLVRRLEGRLGIPLFERTTRRVELTVAGAALHADLAPAYDTIQAAMRRVRSGGYAMTGTLRVGYLTHARDAAFIAAVKRLQDLHAGCSVATVDITGSLYFEVLRSGDIDVALGRFGPQIPDDLQTGPAMAAEPWLLAVSKDHPLATSGSVSVEVLGEYPIFGVPDTLTGALHNPIYPTVTPGGRPIRYRGIARSLADVLALVAAGENVFPTSASFTSYYGHPGVYFIPLYGWPPATRRLLLRRNANPMTAEFTRIATEVAAKVVPALSPMAGQPAASFSDAASG
jgi:DNA-binding transcriptional LysR family regulator